MSDHEHVILDEEVFQAYQEVALYAHYVENPGLAMQTALERLEAALEASLAASKVNPRHHQKSGL